MHRALQLLAIAGIFLLLSAGAAMAAAMTFTSKSLTTFKITQKACSLIPAADGYYDRDTNVSVGNADLSVRSQNGNKWQRTFVRFDTSAGALASAGCSDLTASRVQRAALRLTIKSGAASGRTYRAHRVSGSNWVDGSVLTQSGPGTGAFTNNNLPTTEANPSGSIVMTNTGHASWILTDDIKQYLGGTANNYGWSLQDSVETASPALTTTFFSRETGTAVQRPTLTIYYTV